MSKRTVAICTILIIAVASAAVAADWSTFRSDASRSGLTADGVGPELNAQWVYESTHAPSPAWPEPGRELNRNDFDYAYHVAIVGGTVYFGSSTDHKVYALDLASGEERWSFFTEGPVRFAPTVVDGTAFVASDDGLLYSLDAATGALNWTYRPAPTDERLMGNGQMISRWPLRSGVVVEDGIAYVSAGMWPSEGVYVCAVDAESGEVIWTNGTSGTMYMAQPHPGALALTGVAPQGAIVLSDSYVFVPTGRNMPACFDRSTGKFVYYRGQPDTWNDRWGGAWAMTHGDLLYGGRTHHGPDIEIKTGESDPWNGDGLIAWQQKNGQTYREMPNMLRAVIDGDTIYDSGSDEVKALDFEAFMGGTGPKDCTKWTAPAKRVYALIKAGDAIVAGGRGTVTAYSAANGAVLSTQEVPGQVRGLAAADGKLIASVNTGAIHCFSADAANNATVTPDVDQPGATSDLATDILETTGISAGYALVVGASDPSLALGLAQASDLRVHCIDPDAGVVADARAAVDAAGAYGRDVVVHNLDPNAMPYASYFADLIVATDDAMDLSARELYRALRPCGGAAYVVGRGETWLRNGGALRSEIRSAKNAVVVTRGALPGAGEWTHQYADAGKSGASEDSLLTLPTKLLWFGDPGPVKLLNRHWKPPSPLSVNGRMFVTGQHSVTGVDAYNGRILWEREFQAVARYPVNAKSGSAVADDDSVYVVTGNACQRLDAATGQTLNTYDLPEIDGADASKLWWDYLTVADRMVIGTVHDENEGLAVFGLTKDEGSIQWIYDAEQAVTHDAVAVADGLCHVLDKTSAYQADQAKRRGENAISKEHLVALSMSTGEVAWEAKRGLAKRGDLRLGGGLLLATGGGRVTVFDAATGKLVSWSGIRMRGFPVIIGDTLYGEPFAYDIKSGEQQKRVHPLTGKEMPWNFARSYGCGVMAGSSSVLMFRSGTAGFCDIATDTGTYNFGGVRAGCYTNAIVANGVMMMPPGDSGCTCSYNYQATVAMVADETDEQWSVFAAQSVPAGESISRVALNFGAPGDRRDADGELWLAFPRPAGLAVNVTVDAPASGYYRVNADAVDIAGTDADYLVASGIEGVKTVNVNLGTDASNTYTVAFHFAELADVAPGDRVFDIKLQGKTAVAGLDVAQEAGGRDAALIKTVAGVAAGDTLKVEFVAKGDMAPILSAIEIVRDN